MERRRAAGQRPAWRIPPAGFGYGSLTCTVPFIICVWKMRS